MSTNAIVYCRISLDKTGEGAGVARQEQDGRALAAARGWNIVEVIMDNDTSAAGTKRRPGFERALDLLATGHATVMVAWALDRVTRNRRDTVRLIEVAQKASATIALVRGSDLDLSTPAGRLTADLLAAVARSEIETKSDRQLRANRQAAEAGRPGAGRRAFGYEADGVTIREDEAAAVKDAYQWVLDGASMRRVAERWNLQGLHSPQAKRNGEPSTWVPASVSLCLRKPRYAGLRAYRGDIIGPATWPALVDAETWHSVQAKLRDPRRRTRPDRVDKALLTGVARCGTCSAPIWAGANNWNKTYRCSASSGHPSRGREKVDEYVGKLVVARLMKPDARVLFASSQGSGDMSSLVEQSDELRARMDALAEAFADGALTQSQLRKGSDRIKARLAELDTKMMSARPARPILDLISAPDVAAAWRGLERSVQRQIIELLMDITLDAPGRGYVFRPETIRIAWKGEAV